MRPIDADRNLLFGVLAIQLELIDAGRFADACAGWAARKDVALAELLVERGWISAEDRIDVETLLERKLRRHGGDAHASLIEATDDRVRGALAGLDDPDVRRSIGDAAPPGGHVLISTMGYTREVRDRYTLTRLHAQGGIGRVWLAHDTGLGRDVALKELRPEQAGNPVVWGRFLEEARITGQLEHPNIVPVHELVRPAEDRHPFYTMRFVRGRTLSEAIREYHRRRAEGQAGPVEFQALLNALVGVCNAVAYAHARGVIHRDLKGQNVVLGDYGEVVVLDWGLAKLVDRPEATETLSPPVAVEHPESRCETVQGQALGTPAYMAPEQAEGRWDRVDRRSDVYGLGAILYEVLAGRPPFDGADTAEVLRKVIHEPPERPGSACPSAPAALEAVCLKALAKRPEARYESARALADEVRHFLADEPVSAYPEPILLRAGRWSRRHRTLVAGAVALLVAAVVGLTAGTVLLGRANARTEQQRLLAVANYRRAEAHFQKAREAVDEYFTKVSESKLLGVPGLQPLRKDLLESARKYYEEFLRDRGDDRSVRAEAAEAWYRLGYIGYDAGSPRDAVAALQEAAGLYEALAGEYPDEPRFAYKLAMSLNDLGNHLETLGRYVEARATHERCLALRERIVRDHPDVPEYRKELGVGYLVVADDLSRAGLNGEGLRFLHRARDVFEGLAREYPTVADYRRRLAGTHRTIGWHQLFSGRADEALQSSEAAVPLAEALVREHPDSLDHRDSLASSHYTLGLIHHRLTGRAAEAIAAYERAVGIVEPLVAGNPSVTDYRMRLGYLYCFQFQLHQAAGRGPEALRCARRARELFAPLAESEGISLYDLACIRALCSTLIGVGPKGPSPEEQALRRRYADRAVEALRRCVAGGYRDYTYASNERDFDSLRGREDFRALLADLKAKAQAPPGTPGAGAVPVAASAHP